MPLFKLAGNKTFVPLPKKPFPELEKVLEDWIELNPHLLLDGEELVIIARQPHNPHGKYLDLLAVDRTGATVVIELKRGQAPREVVAQAIEYAAWVDSLDLSQLNQFVSTYSAGSSNPASDIADLYRRTFVAEGEEGEETGADPLDRVTFNHSQRIVIVAESFPPEVEQSLRYLRTRFGVDIYGVQFSVHSAETDTVLSIETIVGREGQSHPVSASPATAWTDEAIQSYVQTPFLKEAVTAIDEWFHSTSNGRFEVRHWQGSERAIMVDDKLWSWFYYAKKWIFMKLYGTSQSHLQQLRDGLSDPASMKLSVDGKDIRFHVTTNDDWRVVQRLAEARLVSQPDEV